MSDVCNAKNAFSEEYRISLRERDEPDGPWADHEAEPLVIWDLGGKFGLFQAWQDPQAGDEPEAVFTSLEDARLALVARSAMRRTRYYRIDRGQDSRPAEGFVVLREGEVRGRFRSFEPAWIDSLNVLTCTAQSPESLAVVLDLAGPARQEEVGVILGRSSLPAVRRKEPCKGPAGEDDGGRS